MLIMANHGNVFLFLENLDIICLYPVSYTLYETLNFQVFFKEQKSTVFERNHRYRYVNNTTFQ